MEKLRIIKKTIPVPNFKRIVKSKSYREALKEASQIDTKMKRPIYNTRYDWY